MNAERLADGLWRWSVADDGGRELHSIYYEARSAVVLVDPAVPDESDPEAERFWRALDRDVARLGRPVVVLVFDPDRAPSADRLLARYRDGAGCRVVRLDG